jgi:hypothetical protein
VGAGQTRARTRPATKVWALVALGAVVPIASLVIPVALAATSRGVRATYGGTGTGVVSGTSGSGSATLAGRGNLIGPGTLRGSAAGVFTSQTCVTFSGTAKLKGSAGSVTLSAHGALACATATDANTVRFTGRATVVGGTSTFAGARGTLPITGTYARQSGEVTISFSGQIGYGNA